MNIESDYHKLYAEFSRSNSKLEEIRNHLINHNMHENEVDTFIKKYISDRCHIRTNNGIKCIFVGGAFLISSMAMTFFNVLPQFRGFILFGLTSIGILIAFVGLYFLFEKEEIE